WRSFAGRRTRWLLFPGWQASTPVGEKGLHRFSQIRHQMIPVGHLQRLGRTLADALGVGLTAIPTHDLYTRVRLEPGCQSRRFPVREQIYGTVPLQINEKGAEEIAAAKRPVVYTKHPWNGACGQGLLAD